MKKKKNKESILEMGIFKVQGVSEEKITGSNPSGASTFHVARQINQTFQLARSMDQILIFDKITQPI